MEGGPYSQENKTGVNIDEVIAAGNAGVTPSGVDVTTKETTDISTGGGNFNRDQQQGGSKLDITYEDPTYAWKPTQQDFGQVDPYSFNFDTGTVPVARFQHGFPAIANRQMGLQQRKEAAAKKQAALTQKAQGGGAQPHDRYKIAFNNYAKSAYAEKRRKLAEGVFKGDMAQTDRFLNRDPDGQRLLKEWGDGWETLAAENKHWTQASIDFLAKHEKDLSWVPAEQLKAIQDYAQAIGPDGMPVRGIDISEFLPKMRKLESSIRQLDFLKEVIAPAFKDRFAVSTQYNLEDFKVGNKYVMTKEQKESFDGMKQWYLENNEDFVDGIMHGNKAKAKEFLDAAFPIQVTGNQDYIARDWGPQKSESSSGSGDVPKPVIGPAEVGTSSTITEEGNSPLYGPSKYAVPGTTKSTVQRHKISVETGGKIVPMGKQDFTMPNGTTQTILPRYIEVHKGVRYVTGPLVNRTGTTVTTYEPDDNGDMVPVTKTIDKETKEVEVAIPEDGNESSFKTLFPQFYESNTAAPNPAGKTSGKDPLGIL